MTKADRQKNAASKKRGTGITLLKKVDDKTFEIVESVNDGMRNPQDVRQYMVEQDHIGTVYPVRIGKPITRAKQEIIKFS